jgi:hypothetical protein
MAASLSTQGRVSTYTVPDRIVPMRVIVCGVHRTGTLSMFFLSLFLLNLSRAPVILKGVISHTWVTWRLIDALRFDLSISFANSYAQAKLVLEDRGNTG